MTKMICFDNKRNEFNDNQYNANSVSINITIAGMHSFKMLYPWKGWMAYQLFADYKKEKASIERRHD